MANDCAYDSGNGKPCGISYFGHDGDIEHPYVSPAPATLEDVPTEAEWLSLCAMIEAATVKLKADHPDVFPAHGIGVCVPVAQVKALIAAAHQVVGTNRRHPGNCWPDDTDATCACGLRDLAVAVGTVIRTGLERHE